MKRYNSIGELLIDYREINNISQVEFAERVNVDARTVQRWERGETLIKSDKEEEIVVNTFLPYQLIRNLNSAIVIPTYYDFRIRKYSTNELSNDLPDAAWFKKEFSITNSNVRKIDYDYDIKYLKKFIGVKQDLPKNNLLAIRKAVEILPELNLIVTDDSGYYAGHIVIFPINEATFLKLRNNEMKEEEITINDLVDYKNHENPIFYNFDIAADNNYSLYFLVNTILRFFSDFKNKEYTYCCIGTRHDSFLLNEQLGLNVVWKEEPKFNKMNLEIYPRFYEGTFNSFLEK